MKKTISYIALCLAVILLFASLSACGGFHNRSYILAKDLISGENLKINLQVERTGDTSPSQRFSVKMGLEELANAVKKADGSLQVTVCRDKMIFIGTKAGAFYLMPTEKVEGDGEDDGRYFFFAPAAEFKIDAPGNTFVDMYVPYHLIDGVQIQTAIGYPEAYPKTLACDSCGSMEEFIQFYSSLKQCSVRETGDDSFTVTYRDCDYQMKVSLSEDGDKSSVTFSVISGGSSLWFDGQGKSDAYVFPVYEGEESIGYMEMLDFLQVPEDVLNTMSTEGLIETCINYPCIWNMYFSSSTLQQGFLRVRDNFNGLTELYKRVDAPEKLVKMFKSIDLYKLQNADHSALLYRCICYMIAQDEIIDNLCESDSEELLSAVRSHIERIEKDFPDHYSHDGPLFVEYSLSMRPDTVVGSPYDSNAVFRYYADQGKLMTSEELELIEKTEELFGD